MKISIILRDITENGGGERVCANLANLLSTAHQVQVISYYKSQKVLPYKLKQQVKLHFLSSFAEKQKSKILSIFLKHIYRLFLTLKAREIFKYDEIIIANDRALAFIKKLPQKQYIRLWHLDFKNKNLRFFDNLVILSSKQLHLWQQIHPKVSVIPNFLPSLPIISTQHSQKRIIAAGRLSKEKGFFRLIEIYEILAKDFADWQLIILGDGTLKESLQEYINAKNLQEFIVLKPFNPNIEEEFLQCSIFAMSSFFEGFGMVLAESASYGLPSVAFDINNGPSDIIEDKKTGFLIKDNDCKGFANALKTLMQDETLRKTMGLEAQKYVKSKFCKEKNFQLWEELFKST